MEKDILKFKSDSDFAAYASRALRGGAVMSVSCKLSRGREKEAKQL